MDRTSVRNKNNICFYQMSLLKKLLTKIDKLNKYIDILILYFQEAVDPVFL